MNDITACNNKDCKWKDTCLRYIAGQKPIIKPNEIHYVIKFDNGTFYNGSRYSCSKISNAKYYPTYEDAEQNKDKVVNLFNAVDKEDLKISKIVISECEVEELL